MSSVKHRYNGEYAERIAIEKLSSNNIFMLNYEKFGLIDLSDTKNHIYFEIKSCMRKIRNGYKNNGYQNKAFGRFLFRQDQHSFLKEKDGYYIFIVIDNVNNKREIIKFEIRKASHVILNFNGKERLNISWKKIFVGDE